VPGTPARNRISRTSPGLICTVAGASVETNRQHAIAKGTGSNPIVVDADPLGGA
jgi:hypothetical protein